MSARTEGRRRRALARAAERDQDCSDGSSADARLDAAALRPALGDALATLPPGQLEVLLLHAWGGLTHEEIAAALGLSSGAVRSRLHRARVHVAARLGPSGNEARDGMLTSP